MLSVQAQIGSPAGPWASGRLVGPSELVWLGLWAVGPWAARGLRWVSAVQWAAHGPWRVSAVRAPNSVARRPLGGSFL